MVTIALWIIGILYCLVGLVVGYFALLAMTAESDESTGNLLLWFVLAAFAGLLWPLFAMYVVIRSVFR